MFDLRGVLTLLTALGAAGCGALTEEGDAAEVSQPVADRAACDAQAAQRRYVSEDRKECQVVFFVCARGESPFFDACGCGCSRP
ncbi:putative lipoprotein [Myxococcus xanthus DK 1622]|uniref:Lipoprotein n=1 Tax=Myxococcus xanthus (strain DK1622) TaxID=246197 RepID=Q1DAX8_MYXXD|nr:MULTISPECIES: hypothetical protein [Myxococcus]ABF92497.1 putative lipoprotein [Myxococcus xanthus DK 1622]NOJ57427.1 hypothetical protein [Myxococcus xanthus]QPM81533.1 hypothetical protein I5Q59_09740 [Myxococcus xanthus]QVW70783.1 hypothetical protein JTM82_15100 [Myxococcus xanthus DZ2]QZZ49698.1 hypothetical protein MyxoNM_10850 [Myxococcus xanthus]